MLGLEAATVVTQPDVISGLAQEEGERVIIVDAVRARALQKTVHEQHGELGLLGRIPCPLPRFTEDVGPAMLSLVRWQRLVFLGIIDVPEFDDEAILCLDLERLYIQPDSSCVVGNIAY